MIEISEFSIWKKLWNESNYSSQRQQIIDAVCERGDSEALQWFWNESNYSSQRQQIIDAVCERGDSEALQWFWDKSNYSSQRQQIIDIMLKQSKTPSENKQNSSQQMDVQGDLDAKAFDIFICHASEDKDEFVSNLASRLVDHGLRVWYDDFTLKLGDSLRRSIDKGLLNSRYGAVVLSPSFFKKEWPQKELDGLVMLESGGKKVILPIWHNITKSDVLKYSPILASKVAVKSSLGIAVVTNEILSVINDN